MRVHLPVRGQNGFFVRWGLLLVVPAFASASVLAQLPPSTPGQPGGRGTAKEKYWKIASEVRGIVTKVLVKKGQHVKVGDVLVQLDDRQAKLNVEMATIIAEKADIEVQLAKAAADEAKAQFDRLQSIKGVQPGVVSAEELSAKRFTVIRQEWEVKLRAADLRMAQAQVAGHRLQLERYTIRAPVDGTVQVIQRRPGEGVQEFSTVIQLQVDGVAKFGD